MSIVESTNVSWKNIKVNQYTDVITGYTYLTLPSSSTTIIATSEGADWEIKDLNLLTRLYNSGNNLQATTQEVKTDFFRNGRLTYNNVRGDAINDRENFINFDQGRQILFDRAIPDATNPVTGQRINANGKASDFNPYNLDVPIESTRQVASSGSVNQDVGTNQGANDLTVSTLNNENTFRTTSGASGLMRYPQANLTEFGYDYIQITGHKYSTAERFRTEGFNYLLTGLTGPAKQRVGTATGTVQLPMQPNLSESNSVDWKPGSMNAITGAFGGMAMDAIDTLSQGQFGQAFSDLISSGTDFAQTIAKDPNLEYFIKAYFAGQAVGANLTARATGSVINPNLELLFNGPRLRDFRFNFTLTPRSEDEAKVIKRIIKFFKKNMRPATSDTGLFLYTPNIFTLEYIHNSGEPHPYLNKFKPCALSQFDVQYTPGGSYATYGDGSMTQYSITMNFNELEPVYQNESSEGTEDGMGF